MSKQAWEYTRDEWAGRKPSAYIVAKRAPGRGYQLWYVGTRNMVELTYGELYQTPQQAKLDYHLRIHKQAVRDAAQAGENVPSAVLACYPGLGG